MCWKTNYLHWILETQIDKMISFLWLPFQIYDFYCGVGTLFSRKVFMENLLVKSQNEMPKFTKSIFPIYLKLLLKNYCDGLVSKGYPLSYSFHMWKVSPSSIWKLLITDLTLLGIPLSTYEGYPLGIEQGWILSYGKPDIDQDRSSSGRQSHWSGCPLLCCLSKIHGNKKPVWSPGNSTSPTHTS